MSVIRVTAPPDGATVYVRADWVMALGIIFTFDNTPGSEIYARNVVMAAGAVVLVLDTDDNIRAVVESMGTTLDGDNAVADADAMRGVR